MSLINRIKVAQKLKFGVKRTDIDSIYNNNRNIKRLFDNALTDFVEKCFIDKYSSSNYDINDIMYLELHDVVFNFAYCTDNKSRNEIARFLRSVHFDPHNNSYEIIIKMMVDSWINDNKRYIVDTYSIDNVYCVAFHIKYINPDFIDS